MPFLLFLIPLAIIAIADCQADDEQDIFDVIDSWLDDFFD